MKRTIYRETRVEDVQEEVAECPCCGSDDGVVVDGNHTGNGCDDFSGYGTVYCKKCGHKVYKHSYNIGYGDEVEGLIRSAVAEWNSQSRSYGKGDSALKSLKRENAELRKRNVELQNQVEALECQLESARRSAAFDLHPIRF